MRNTLVTYDRENDRIGFWKTNCSELGKRLNTLTAPPPAPLPFDRKNTSAGVLSTIPPSGLPPTALPGGVSLN